MLLCINNVRSLKHLFTRVLHKNILTIDRILPKCKKLTGKFAPEKRKRETAECSGLGADFLGVLIFVKNRFSMQKSL